jgi:hypothetical protein
LAAQRRLNALFHVAKKLTIDTGPKVEPAEAEFMETVMVLPVVRG